MKIIHCADLHIGSKMDSKYPKEKAIARRQELRDAFVHMVEEGSESDVQIILISGDAFDSDHPGEKDLEYFYGVIEAHPEINFFYLHGNHDLDGFKPSKQLDNLWTFGSEKWMTYTFEDEKVSISGIEITESNKENYYDFPGLLLKADNFNIAMLHGQVPADINLKRLAHRSINYFALGHIHSFKQYELEDHGRAIYCGTLEPRGFDETGEKGYVLIDTDERKFYFQPFNKRTIHLLRLDVSGFQSEFEVSNALKNLLKKPGDIYRIELVGEKEKDYSIEPKNLVSRNQSSCFFLDVIDETTRKGIDKEVDLQSPLAKEFFNQIRSDGTLDPKERAAAIEIGLKALAGKEF